MNRPRRAVAWFLKAPMAGTVKTRMQPRLGRAGALRLHLALVQHMALRLSDWQGGRVRAWVAGWRSHPSLRGPAAGFPRISQRGRDLGERMHHALTAELDKADYAAVIGSDCPGLDGSTLDRAFAELERGADVVLGPARDGGYYLIAMRRADPRLFANMRWGHSAVYVETLRRARRGGLRVASLPVLRDVDRPEDLVAVRGPGSAPLAAAASPGGPR